MLAGLSGVEELTMEQDEARKLATSISNVAQYYEALPGMSEKTAAWVGLGMALGASYGPRVAAYRMRMANDARDAARKKGAQNVVSIVS